MRTACTSEPGRAWRANIVLPLIALLLHVVVPGVAVHADNNVLTEPGTGARFPTDVSFARGGSRYHLSATGMAVRTKFWLRIYSIAHYLEAGPDATQAQVLARIMSDDTAKQVILEFARDLSAGQVRDGFVESFSARASAAQLRALGPALREFLRAIRKDVSRGDRVSVRWLPGGRLLTFYNGKPAASISDRAFARLFWSVWFGEASIVDREQLIALRVLEPDAEARHLRTPQAAIR